MTTSPTNAPVSGGRSEALRRLADEQFDLAIVGGGITGAGIARDASLRGLKVALIEKLDFGAGTSSKSSKMVHDGLRYLENGELGLVFESVNERNFLMTRARHLVRPLPFLVPSYQGDRRGLMTVDLGVWIYEALCLFRAPLGMHRTYGPRGTLEIEPAIKREGLKGGIVYHDGRTDDARLTLENVLDARAQGAVAVNHVRAGALLRQGDRVIGLTVHDELSKAAIDVRARLVVNATGPWSDEVRALAGNPGMLKPARGSHLVVDSKRLPVNHALLMFAPRDQRVVFCIPWGLGRTVIGTTDTFYEGSLDDVYADRDDAEYLLATANKYCPDAKLTFDDVLSTWSGLRPLVKPSSDVNASKVSREHVVESKPGFITIAGGKLTTYRRMAQDLVDLALTEQLGGMRPHSTLKRPLPGANGLDSEAALQARREALRGFGDDVAENLTSTYGIRGATVADRIAGDATASERLDAELPFLAAQVDEAVDVELAATLDDVLSRRVPLLLRGRDQGLAAADPVSQRMAKKLGWDEARRQAELGAYRAVVERSRRFKQA
ncbi:MAG: glycerol-3-phosphate dehydrogenase/oxidase [Archangiaceae bacterium]|nr:glycerol-3-phosphate dehydrogenase/oxidase [Archangiaceae bacterium]